MDQGSDIQIPIIEIGPDWTVDDIHTIDDCDDAHAYLTGAICAIESRLDMVASEGREMSEIGRRLKSALRWKKAALQVTNSKRGKIIRKERAESQRKVDRLLLERIKLMYPSEFESALKTLPELEE